MCGIAAIFAYSPDAPNVDSHELLAIRDRMITRGPDGAGTWISMDQRVGLGHRRLSVVDLSQAGAQPMFTPTGSIGVTFNGEIYNYRALRSQLEAKGYLFRSNSDTEVLLYLYAQKGPAMVHDLRGMYAFAIWDAQAGGLFLARDPFGIKPLYYANDGRTIRVASQVKALRANRLIDTSPEPAGHVGFFLWGHVPDPFTLYRGIRALSAGHAMWIDQSGCQEPREFCSIPGILADARAGATQGSRDNSALLRSAFRDTVARHLVADVPVGVFLSSGLDSSTLTALAAHQHPNIKTVTLGFDEYRQSAHDETPLAEQVARSFGTEHRTIWVTRRDFEESEDSLFGAMDQPSIDGVNTYFVSLAARRAGLTVALSGLGGDELFGGYPGFQQIPRTLAAIRSFRFAHPLGRLVRALSAGAISRFTSPKYAGLLEYGNTLGGVYLLRRGLFMPWELPNLLHPDLARAGWQDLAPVLRLDQSAAGIPSTHAQIVALELTCYMRQQLLRDADWAGMAHSLEIRVPLVDLELFKALAPLLTQPAPPTKQDMARAAPRPLPKAVLDRVKTGFTIPVRDWLMASRDPLPDHERGLRGWARDVYARFADPLVLRRPSLRRTGPLPGSRPHAPGKDTRLSPTSPTLRPCVSLSRRPTLALVTDAFGGFGGMAKFNRNFLTALAKHPSLSKVIALPLIMASDPGPMPPHLIHRQQAVGSRSRFVAAVVTAAWELHRANKGENRHQSLGLVPSWGRGGGPRPLIFCGHICLLPAAFAAQRVCGGRVFLIVHGIEAWQPTKSLAANFCARRVDGFIAVSQVTKRRFLRWSRLRLDQGVVLPNCIDLAVFGPGQESEALLGRYGLRGKRVLMTLGRLAADERYKGIDEVLEVLPALSRQVPNLSYLIVGDGPDRPRLEQKAVQLGVGDRVRFAGRIPDAEKVEHYRLADVYVMPSSGEGFGIVYLEALACGVPVIGGKTDGSREALRDGQLGQLVDPKNAVELQAAILRVLQGERNGATPRSGDGIDYFSTANFERRVHEIVDSIVA